MKTRKTQRARRVLWVITASVLLAIVLASFPLALLALSLSLAYALLRMSFMQNARALTLQARRSIAETALYADSVAHVRTTVLGRIPPSLRLTLRDTPPQGWPVVEGSVEAEGAWKASPEVAYGARPTARGSWRFGAAEVIARDGFGLFEAIYPLACPLEVRVNASLEAVRKGRAYARKRPFQPRRKSPLGLIFREFEFEGLRPYQGGDRLRDIHWKATTKLQTMMTKIFEREMEGVVYCIVDASRSMREKTPGTSVSKLDHAAELVLQVGEIASMRNFQLGLLAYDELSLILDVPASRSRGQERILAERVLALPGSLETGHLFPTGERDVQRLPDEEAFLSIARQLRMPGSTESALALQSAKRRRPAPAEAAQRLVALHPPGSLFIFLLTDLATEPDEVVRAVTILRDRQHSVTVGILPEDKYVKAPGDPTVRDVEAAYLREQARRRARGLMARKGATVVPLDPLSSASTLTKGGPA